MPRRPSYYDLQQLLMEAQLSQDLRRGSTLVGPPEQRQRINVLDEPEITGSGALAHAQKEAEQAEYTRQRDARRALEPIALPPQPALADVAAETRAYRRSLGRPERPPVEAALPSTGPDDKRIVRGIRTIKRGESYGSGEPMDLTRDAERGASPSFPASLDTRRREAMVSPDVVKEVEKAKATAEAKPRFSTGQQFAATTRLQRDYDKVRAPVREMDRALRVMKSGLEMAKKGNMNAGSQQVLVTFQKVLDPTSVVRESEYARSPQSMSFLQQLQGTVEKHLANRGGAGVPVGELESFVRAAEDMRNSLTGITGDKRRQLEKTALQFELDPSLIFDDEADETETLTGAPVGSYEWYQQRRGGGR